MVIGVWRITYFGTISTCIVHGAQTWCTGSTHFWVIAFCQDSKAPCRSTPGIQRTIFFCFLCLIIWRKLLKKIFNKICQNKEVFQQFSPNTKYIWNIIIYGPEIYVVYYFENFAFWHIKHSFFSVHKRLKWCTSTSGVTGILYCV